MYVDDIAGVSSVDDVEADLASTKEIAEDLMGLGAVADKKTERDGEAVHNSPGQLDFIEYSVDLRQTQTDIDMKASQAGIARKNVFKAFIALHAIEDGQNVHVKAALAQIPRQLLQVEELLGRLSQVLVPVIPVTINIEGGGR